MFTHLTDFAYKRSGKEAFGFYLAWFLVLIILCGVVGGLLAPFSLGSANFQGGFTSGLKLGALAGFIFSTYFGIAVAKAKNLFSDFKIILLLVCTAVLAAFGGVFLGMIIPAYLTTRHRK